MERMRTWAERVGFGLLALAATVSVAMCLRAFLALLDGLVC